MDNYREVFKEYLRCSSQTQATIRVLSENAAHLGLERARTMLSVGPGFGEVEKHIIENYMPKLQKVVLVDQDAKFLEASLKAIESIIGRKFEVRCIHSRVQGVGDLPFLCDFVLMAHCLYNIENPGDVLETTRTWLKPNVGKMAVIMAHCDTDYDQILRGFANMHEPSEFVFGNTETVEMELRKLGMNYDVFRVTYEIRFDLFDPHLLVQFMLRRSAESGEADDLNSYLKSHLQSGTPCDSSKFCLKQKASCFIVDAPITTNHTIQL